MKTRTYDGIQAGHKHSAPDIHMKILERMHDSRRHNRVRKPNHGIFKGSPILTRVCTKAEVKEAGR